MANETMVLLEKIVVPAAGASSITFTNIPQSYTDLQITMSSRVDAANGVAQLYFNGSTASDKRWLRVYGDGSSAVSGNSSGLSAYFRPIGMNRSDQTASVFGNMSIYIPNYTSSSTYKSMSADGVNENNATFAEAALNAGLWESNSAITSITIIPSAGNFVQYSTFYLYGIAKEGVTPTNAPAATGGDSILFDGTYWIHTFRSSGTFTPKKALSCDYLVVAGGGSGANLFGGGGGGGMLTGTSSITANTAVTVTVGAGGAAAPTGITAANGANGSNSVFNSITATGGGYGGAAAAGASGGSGGGGGAWAGVSYAGGTGTSGQGNNGSAGSTGDGSGGGGGGAGAAGGTATTSVGGAGGNGSSSSISGSSVTYAGGGGGGAYTGNTTSATGGAGGTGGGGAGGQSSGSSGSGTGVSGTVNTGGGGGGGTRAAQTNITGGAGGSGIVIVRYAA
jgi:hypothetical protein